MKFASPIWWSCGNYMLLNNFLFTGLQFPPTILMLQEPAVVLADHIVILLRLGYLLAVNEQSNCVLN